MKKQLLITMLILAGTAMLNAAARHVGASQTYATVAPALAAAQAGDTIYLHAGLYTGLQLASNVKGTKAQKIVITRFKNDAVSISGGWQFSSIAHIKLYKLKFSATGAEPGRLLNIDYGAGCSTISHNIIIDSCYFLNSTSAYPSSAAKFGGVDTFEIKNCVIKNNTGEGWGFNVAMNGKISGCLWESNNSGALHFKLGSKNVYIQQNLFKSNGGIALELGGSSGAFFCSNATSEAENIHVYSNVFADCFRGISFNSSVNCDVINNVFYKCTSYTMRVTIDSPVYPLLTGNVVKNNIFAFGGSAAFFGYLAGPTAIPANALSFSKNIYYSTTSATFTFNDIYFDNPYWNNVKEVNPLVYNSTNNMFVSASTGDFHLASGSPAIAVGATVSAPTADYYGYLFKSTRSIGAAEFNSTPAGIENVMDVNTFSVFPNPANTEVHFTLKHVIKDNDIIEVIDMVGKQVKTINAAKVKVAMNDYMLDVSDLTNGIYILKINNQKSKMIVQH